MTSAELAAPETFRKEIRTDGLPAKDLDLLARLSRPKIDSEPIVAFEDYHRLSLAIGDVDPSYSLLRYVCDRFELNREQRFWVAFLYSTTYCGATTFAIYNDFPDFETLDEGRLNRWWAKNKDGLLFQTDRLRIKTSDKWVETVLSYRDLLSDFTRQETFFFGMETPDPFHNYEEAFRTLGRIRNVGRFTLFLLTEAIHVVTGWNMRPRSMDLRDAASCRNGLAEAISRPDLNTHDDRKRKLPKEDLDLLQNRFDDLVSRLEKTVPGSNVWNIETTLCAFKKWTRGQRYVGFYLDRQHDEIVKMERNVPEGVDWSVLWDYRRETFDERWLAEQSKP